MMMLVTKTHKTDLTSLSHLSWTLTSPKQLELYLDKLTIYLTSTKLLSRLKTTFCITITVVYPKILVLPLKLFSSAFAQNALCGIWLPQLHTNLARCILDNVGGVRTHSRISSILS